MKSAKKKSTAKQRRVSESDASLLFFQQGEANAEAERVAYERELAEAARPRGLGRRWWMLAAAAAALLIATLLYVASS
jgi:hypothetical protein